METNTNASPDNETIPVNMNKYALRFIIWYVIGTVCYAVLKYFFSFGSNSMPIVFVFIAALITNQTFLKDHSRDYTPSERKFIKWRSFHYLLILNALLLSIAWVSPLGPSGQTVGDFIMKKPTVFLYLTLFLLALTYLALQLTYGWIMKNNYKNHMKHKQK